MRPDSSYVLSAEYSVEITLTDHLTSSVISTDQSQRAESQQATTSDKTTGVLACLEAGAIQLGSSLKDLLKQTKAVTLLAPELVAGTLAGKSGSRIGLVVTQGYEATAYGRDASPNLLIDSILSKELIAGIAETTNDQGQQVLFPETEEVKDKFRHLLELGSSIIVVSFKNAALNPANERRLQEIMRSDYPRHYLGAVPVLLASDFSRDPDDLARTNICLLNAYTWFSLDQTLRRIEAVLRQHNYRRSLLVAQTDGPAVPIPKVTPLKTCGIDQQSELSRYTIKREKLIV
jgi:N-methylhydantoinase A/oxoprolinase/acetone carboxylase beta subunit